MATAVVSAGCCTKCARQIRCMPTTKNVFQSITRNNFLGDRIPSLRARSSCFSAVYSRQSQGERSSCSSALPSRVHTRTTRTGFHSFSKRHVVLNSLKKSWNGGLRNFSETVPVPEEDQYSGTNVHAEKLIQKHLTGLCEKIKSELQTPSTNLGDVSKYYFDGQGKYFRPVVVLLMSRACNKHVKAPSDVTHKQETVAMITEMIHTASLLHDDVIDNATSRRAKPSVNGMFGDQSSIIGGDFIMSRASMALARTGNEAVVELIATAIRDLVRGELLQLIPSAQSSLQERFDLYLQKTFLKTASLISYTCKSAAVLSGAAADVQEIAYEYGRNLGLAFQLIDDVLDFVSCEEVMGKPAATDLKLGLATAPVLFASQKHPELNELIGRRFSKPGDVERARDAVEHSDGISKTYDMASQHCHDAVRHVQRLCPSPERDALIKLTEIVLSRKK